MDLQLQTALIAAAVGLATALIGSMAAWRLERRRWLTGLKASIQLEVHKSRMQTYPSIFALFAKMSTRVDPPLDPSSAAVLASGISEWLYSAGGMTAEASTRGALFVVRERLRQWHREGSRPTDFYVWRNRALLLIRRDIDVSGLESYESEDLSPLLQQVRLDADAVSRRARRRVRRSP